MTYQPRDGDGSLFVNTYKETEQQPDYTGNILINGVEWRLSGWKKTSKDGTRKYLSLSARPKVQKSTSAPPAAAEEGFEEDKDLPF